MFKEITSILLLFQFDACLAGFWDSLFEGHGDCKSDETTYDAQRIITNYENQIIKQNGCYYEVYDI